MLLYFYSEVEESRAGRFLDTSSGPGLLASMKKRREGVERFEQRVVLLFLIGYWKENRKKSGR